MKHPIEPTKNLLGRGGGATEGVYKLKLRLHSHGAVGSTFHRLLHHSLYVTCTTLQLSQLRLAVKVSRRIDEEDPSGGQYARSITKTRGGHWKDSNTGTSYVSLL